MKMQLSKPLSFLAISALVALTACDKLESKKDDAKLLITASASMEAEELATAGEQLVTPYNFHLADKVFDMALAKDANNFKARFYKALLKIPMTTKGLATRVKPLLRTTGDINVFQARLDAKPDTPLKQFLLDGTEDIATAEDLQTKVIDQQMQAAKELRDFLKQNQNTEMIINLNVEAYQRYTDDRFVDTCAVVSSREGSEYVFQCDVKGKYQRKVNSSDLVVMTQAASGMYLSYIMGNAYSHSGAEKVLIKLRDQNFTPQEAYSEFELEKNLGVLRSNHQLAEVQNLGADGIAAYKWAVQYKASLCPKPINGSTSHNAIRRQGYLFDQGICVDDSKEAMNKLATAEQALTAPVKVFLQSGKTDSSESTKFEARVDYLALARKPIADLRLIGPSDFNNCGKVTALKDATLGGSLPDGEGNKILNTRCGN